ncbi:MAG: PTS sugar transporter subunit IIA, partial [Brachybacterium tyrofermentans]
NSPRYDEVVELVHERNDPQAETDSEPVAGATAATVGAGAAGAAGAGAGGGHGRRAAEKTAPQHESAGAAGASEAPDSSDAAAASDTSAASPEILSPGSIVLTGTATDSASGIDEAGALLVGAGAVDQGYVDAMHAREATVSTFMGNGLAIPHGTNDAKSTIKRSAMSFVRFPDGIEWNGNPTKFVIGIAGVGNEHLELLQKVAMTFSDPAQVERLEQATSAEEILAIFGDEKE